MALARPISVVGLKASAPFRVLHLLVSAGLLVGGLALFIAPGAANALFGLPGRDLFATRLLGAAVLGFAVAVGLGSGSGWRGLRIPMLAALTCAIADLIAVALSLAFDAGTPGVLLIVSIATVVAILALTLTAPSPPPALDERPIARWCVLLLMWGVVAAALFGFGGLLLGASAGKLVGLAGADGITYRLAGAWTLGYLVGSALGIRSKRWSEIGPAIAGSVVVNAFSLIAAVFELLAGAPLIAYAILAAALFNTAALSLVYVRRGRAG